MQGRIPGSGGVGIGALVQQKSGQHSVPTVCGNDQWRATVGCRVVDLRSRLEQQHCRFDIALPRREQQGREPALLDFAVGPSTGVDIHTSHKRTRVDIGTMLDERPRDLGMALRHGPHERRLTT